MSLRQLCHKDVVIWLISIELLECIARVFSSNLGASRIACKALVHSKVHLISGLVEPIKMGLSQSGLQHSDGLTIISFKSQLSDSDLEGILVRSLLVYSR